MTDNEKKDILSNLDSKIVKYIGKKVIEDIESEIDDLLPNKDKAEKNNPPKKIIDKNNDQETINDEKGIVASIDDKLDEIIGENTANEIEEDLLSLMPGHIDNVDDLGSKLDSFLTKTNHYGIEIKESTNKESQKTEEKFTNQKVENELQKLKQTINTNNKTTNSTVETNKEPTLKTTDQIVEKKFKNREIEDALAALKAKCSIKKEPTEKMQSQNNQKPDENISNEEIDSSLQDLLKNLDKK